MKLYNCVYEDLNQLQRFVQSNLNADDHLLIQLFCGDIDLEKIQTILDYLNAFFPNGAVIGSTTAGEIHNGMILHQRIIISFCVLESARVEVHYLQDVSRESAKRFASRYITPEVKACIAFAETFGGGDSESFLEGLIETAPKVMIAGGNAGDDFTFSKTFVMHANRIENEGIVLALLYGESLYAAQHYSFGWTQIGKVMTVTRCDKGTLYELDNHPVEEVYRHYFGDDILTHLPNSTIAFPLVKLKEGIDVCRDMISVNADRSYVFAGHFQEGDHVRFAIGNVEEIMHEAEHLQQKIYQNPVEAMFIYSCSVRNLFLKEQLHYEFGLLEQIAPAVGFFTFGEFFHVPTQNHLLNVTTTVLSLSESKFSPKPPSLLTSKPNHSSLKFLTHLVNTTQRELDESINALNQYKMALDQSAIVSKMDTQGRITYVNESFCALTKLDREEIIGSFHSRFRHPHSEPAVYEDLWRTISRQKIWSGVLKCTNPQNDTFYLKSTLIPFVDENNQTVEYMTCSADITELVLKERMIQEQSIDELTGLSNRVALLREIRHTKGEKLLVLINLVGFSEINDYLGYDVGDVLLKEIATLLSSFFNQKNETAFRINGDEFALLLKEGEAEWKQKSYEKVQYVVHSLENRVFMIEGYEVVVRLNVGMALGADEKIYMQSHIALKEAKKRDQALVSFHTSDELKHKTEHNIHIIHKIQKAIENDRIVPFYQGIYDNRLKQITKYEVLIRLKEEDGNYLSPYFFLEQAKKTRLYEKLTKIMLEKSFAYLYDKGVDFSLNFTKSDILSASVKACLFDNIRKYGCGKRVILEIVESEGIDNFEEIAVFIQEVKRLGCRIAIDDFGTGYSNFAYLSQLSVDFVKIDGSLIKEIDTNRTKAMTVETIISFAHKMHYKIVAEFVDRTSVQKKLERLRVDFSQGYLFSKPSPIISL